MYNYTSNLKVAFVPLALVLASDRLGYFSDCEVKYEHATLIQIETCSQKLKPRNVDILGRFCYDRIICDSKVGRQVSESSYYNDNPVRSKSVLDDWWDWTKCY